MHLGLPVEVILVSWSKRLTWDQKWESSYWRKRWRGGNRMALKPRFQSLGPYQFLQLLLQWKDSATSPPTPPNLNHQGQGWKFRGESTPGTHEGAKAALRRTSWERVRVRGSRGAGPVWRGRAGGHSKSSRALGERSALPHLLRVTLGTLSLSCPSTRACCLPADPHGKPWEGEGLLSHRRPYSGSRSNVPIPEPLALDRQRRGRIVRASAMPVPGCAGLTAGLVSRPRSSPTF